MKHQSRLPIFVSAFLIFSVLFFSYSASVSAQEVENEREFDYLQNSGKGPEHWGDLKKEWAACKKGGLQSPIDMSSSRVKVINRYVELTKRYKPSHAVVKNRGHDISIIWRGNDAGSIKIIGTEYLLQQAHWHSPSEHTVNGRRYAMELHMVHLSKDPKVKNNIAVIGVLFKFGASDAFLSKLISNITSMTDHVEEKDIGVIDPRSIKVGGKKYYRYVGSLTVPPCTEGVIWTMNKKVRTVSRDQVRALRIAVHDYAEANSRPVQPINRREIRFYGPNPRNIRS